MAAFTLYDVLRRLVTASRLPEHETKPLLESIDEAEKLSILGYVATSIECPHNEDDIDPDTGRCGACGRQMFVRDQATPRRYVRPDQQTNWR